MTEAEVAAMERNIASVKATNKAVVDLLDRTFYGVVGMFRAAGCDDATAYRAAFDALNKAFS